MDVSACFAGFESDPSSVQSLLKDDPEQYVNFFRAYHLPLYQEYSIWAAHMQRANLMIM
jgi:hypothetical protein